MMSAPRAAAEVHRRLEAAVHEYRRAEKNVVALFAEVLHGRLFVELGYSDIVSYSTQALGFSRAKTSEFTQLSKAMREMPALKRAVEREELEWTKAVTVARVASKDSAAQWVELAKKSTRQELRKQVQRAKQRPAAAQLEMIPQSAAEQRPLPPTATTVSHRMSAMQLERYERALEKLRQRGSSDVELLLQALELAASGKFGRPKSAEPNSLVVIYECESCQAAHTKTTRGDKPLSGRERAAARCDAILQREGKRRKTIPPRMRRQVLERDRHRCATRGCTNTRGLQIHHRDERNKGGKNDAENLITLCRSCHEMMHRGLTVP
jgi:hypothetical protein